MSKNFVQTSARCSASDSGGSDDGAGSSGHTLPSTSASDTDAVDPHESSVQQAVDSSLPLAAGRAASSHSARPHATGTPRLAVIFCRVAVSEAQTAARMHSQESQGRDYAAAKGYAERLVVPRDASAP